MLARRKNAGTGGLDVRPEAEDMKQAQLRQFGMRVASATLLSLLVAACGGGQETDQPSTASTFLSGEEDRLYGEGLEAWRAGDTVTAETRFRGSIAANSRYLAAHISLAQLLLELERAAEAASGFETAIGLRDRSVDAHLGLARARLLLGETTAARDSAVTAATLAEASGNATFQANCFGVLGNAQEALGDIEAAIGSYERALQIDTGTTDARIGLAMLYASLGRTSESVRVLGRASQYEHSPDALVRIGIAFYDLHVYDRAIEALERAYALDRNDDDLLYYYASAAVRSGRNDLGIQLASDLLARDDAHLGAYVVRGEANLDRGYTENASRDVGVVLTADPEHYDALVLDGDIAREAEHYDDARSRYEQALSVRPGHVRAIDHLAQLHAATGDWNALVALLEPAVARDDRIEGWLGLLIDAMLRAGLYERVVPYESQLALSRPSDDPLNFRVAERALQFPGSLPPETVLRHAELAVEHVGGAPLAYRMALFDALLGVGRTEEAEEMLDVADELFPNADEISDRRRRLR